MRALDRTLVLVLILAGTTFAQAPIAAEVFGLDSFRQARLTDRFAAACGLIADHPDNPWAAYLLDRIREDERFAVDRDLESSALVKALANPEVDGHQRQLYRRRLIQVLASRGEKKRSLELAAKDGVLRSWLVAGPFGFDARSLHDHAFAPELSVQVKDSMPGSIEPRRWRRARLGPTRGLMAPEQFLGTRYSGCAYALAQVRVPDEGDYALTIEAGTSFKLWSNGRLVADVDRSRERVARTGIHPVHFAAGWNRILVKISDNLRNRGRQGLRLRVSTLLGDPVVGMTVEEGGELRSSPAPGDPPSVELPPLTPVEKAVSAMESQEGVAGRLLAALTLRMEGLEADGWELIALEQTELERPVSTFAVAEFLDSYSGLPATLARQRARDLARECFKRDPAWLPRPASSPRSDSRMTNPKEALALLEGLDEEARDSLAVQDSLASIYDEMNWATESLAVRRHQLSIEPRFAPALAALERHYRGLGNLARAREYGGRWMEVEQRRVFRASEDFGRALRRGDLSAARQGLAELRRIDVREELNEDRETELLLLEWRQGKTDALAEVLSRLEAAAIDQPHDAAPLERAARLLVEAGREKDAKALQPRILARNPAEPLARRSATDCESRHLALFDEFAIDPREAMLASRDLGERYPGASSVLLIDQIVTVVENDGYVGREIHQLIWLRDRNAVEQFGQQAAPGEVVTVRTILPDGTSLEPLGRTPFTMPRLEPGVFVEVRHRERVVHRLDVPMDIGGFFFQDRRLRSPFHLTRWVVSIPAGHRLELTLANYEGDPTVEKRGDHVVYVLEKRSMGLMAAEPHMPDPEGLVPLAQFYSRDDDWKQVNQAMLDEISPLIINTPAVRKATLLAIGEAVTDVEKSRAIHAWIMSRIKTEKGDFLPDHVLASQRGLRLPLMMAMLRSAGVDCRYARARRRVDFTEPMDWRRRNQVAFQASLIKVIPQGEQPFFLGTESRFLPFGLLPIDLTGSEVFVASPGCGSIEKLPTAEAWTEVNSQSFRIVLGGDRSFGEARLEFPRVGAARLKDVLAGASRRQTDMYVNQLVARCFGGLNPRIFDMDILNADDPDQAVVMTASFELAKLLSRSGDRLSVHSLITPLPLSQIFVQGRKERVHPLVIAEPIRMKHEVELLTGRRYRIESIPDPVLESGPAGTFRYHHQPIPGGVKISREIELGPCRISPKEYADFTRFCRRVDEKQGARIILREIKP